MDRETGTGGDRGETDGSRPGRSDRVLLVTEASGGGVGRHVVDLAKGLVASGFEVHLLYSGLRMESRFQRDVSELRGVRLEECPMRRSPHASDLVAAAAIRRYARSRGPFRVAHGHSSKGGALVRMAAVGSGLPRIYTPHAFRTQDPTLSPVGRWVFSTIERQLSRITDAIVVLSQYEYEHARRLGIAEHKLRLVHNGLDADSLGQGRFSREDLGLSPEDLVIGFVGRLCPQKAPERMLQLCSKLAPQHPRLRVVMVGDGPNESELRRLEKALGIGDRVVWMGAVDGVAAMTLFDVFVLPSRYEGMPYVLLEALFKGLPIVVTSVGGAVEAVSDRVNGFIVPQGDPDRLAAAVKALIADRALRAKMSLEATKRSHGFLAEEMVRNTVGVYESADRRRRGSAGSDAGHERERGDS